MSAIVGAVIGALAALLIPVAAWLSQRATREGRLLLRVERLGNAYEVMPESQERRIFESHLRQAISRLNNWLDAERRARRRLQRLITITTYFVGLLVLSIAVPIVGVNNGAASSAVGVVVGVLVSVVSLGSSYLIERSAGKAADRAARAEGASAEARRLEALRKGENPDPVAAPLPG